MSSDPNRIRTGVHAGVRIESHERTNERTYGEPDPAVDHETAVDARARMEIRSQEPVPIQAAAAEWIDIWEAKLQQRRWPVIRRGEREPIAPHVRAAVWYRDGGTCDECMPEYPRSEVLHLDHIVPWSAGGADTSDNLRLLCEFHNIERSNFVDFAQPKRAVTWWCANCYSLDEHEWRHDYPYVTCPHHGADPRLANARCRVARAYARAWINEQERPTWHERPLLTSFDTVAYCAHCNAPGMTEAVL